MSLSQSCYFEAINDLIMTIPERKDLIASYGKAYEMLTAALWQYPVEMWQWRPRPDQWSIHEIIIHIADSEANSYIRCRRMIAEPGSGVYSYDENKWAQALDYHSRSTDEALDLFKVMRQCSWQLIKDQPDEVWHSATIQHSENGAMTMEDWLRIYEEHIPVHIRQMERTYRAWLDRAGNG
ncbi:MAG: DinB family protein [Bacteroidetes bacterium]|nr:DinB family protein [Bacteroidota bacterium]